MTRVILGALAGVAVFATIGVVLTGCSRWLDYCYRISGGKDWGFVLFASPYAALLGAVIAWMTR